MNTFDEIIQTKAYSDLTPAELEIIRELVSSEQEYNEMKGFYTEINQLSVSSREEVSPSVKSSLNSIFQAKHPGIRQNWNAPISEPAEAKVIPLYNRNWFRVAALLVVSAGVATIWISAPENKSLQEEDSIGSTQMAQTAPAKEESTAKVEKKKPFPIEDSNPSEYTASSTLVTPENQQFKALVNEDEMRADGDRSPIELRASSETVYFSNSPAPKAEKVKEEAATDYFTKTGIDADLNPFGNIAEKKAESSEISTNDLLSLIEPSF